MCEEHEVQPGLPIKLEDHGEVPDELEGLRASASLDEPPILRQGLVQVLEVVVLIKPPRRGPHVPEPAQGREALFWRLILTVFVLFRLCIPPLMAPRRAWRLKRISRRRALRRSRRGPGERHRVPLLRHEELDEL